MGEAHPAPVGGTALRVAVRRAAHQLLDHPKVFDDPLALRIIGPEAEARLRSRIGGKEREWNTSLRAWIAARSRYAEDQLSLAVLRGARQYIILGAGLDTFAYRNPHHGLHVFEVDHPATREWKQAMLAAAQIHTPASVSFAGVDFEHHSLAAELAAHGFETSTPAFVSWLGVTPFLSSEGFRRTLSEIAPLADRLVFDYTVAPEALEEQDRFAFDILSRRVAAAGEPYRLHFTPPELHALLAQSGFSVLEDLGKREIHSRYFAGRTGELTVRFTPSRLVLCAPSKTSGFPAA